MRIVRFIDEAGSEYFGTDYHDGRAVVLDGEIYGELRPSGATASVQRLLAPIAPVNIFGIGLNYRAHAKETGAELPENPVVFMKPTTAISGPGDPILIPKCSVRGPEVDYEAELAVIIGRAARDVSREDALDCVLGYTVANDISARKWQKHGGAHQWIRGKSFDGFCPLGPVLVTRDEIPDPQSLSLTTILNGATMQQGSTDDMIFSVAELISYLSQDTTLLPGTLILTGTPPGVGFARKPPVFLMPGDEVSVEIAGIGRLNNPVQAG
jgi:2-keto-4-pentenoate hydratase/2-oxohepta-3-ene-1,7-dioic acid hydratase in catechol pathway